MAAPTQPIPEPVPERDWFEQLMDSLREVTMNARVANASETSVTPPMQVAEGRPRLWGQTILDKLRKPRRSNVEETGLVLRLSGRPVAVQRPSRERTFSR